MLEQKTQAMVSTVFSGSSLGSTGVSTASSPWPLSQVTAASRPSSKAAKHRSRLEEKFTSALLWSSTSSPVPVSSFQPHMALPLFQKNRYLPLPGNSWWHVTPPSPQSWASLSMVRSS